jgi:DNA polymerase III epsilon subunit-like protein
MESHLLRFDKKKTFTFLDFETENLNLYLPMNLPWQISMLRVQGEKIIAEADFYVKWHRPLKVSEGAALVTRFNQDNIDFKGTDYRTVVKQTVEWTSNCDYIIGHNVLGFDLHLLKFMYEMEGVDASGLAEKIIDTHALAKGIKLGNVYNSSRTSLVEYQYRMINTYAKGVKTNMTTLGKEYNIKHDYETLHNSLSDLYLNLKLWNKIKWQVEI